MTSYENANSYIIASGLWSDDEHVAYLYGKDEIPLGEPPLARPKIAVINTHTAAEIAIENFELDELQLTNVLTVLLMTNHLAGIELNHKHPYDSTNIGGIINSDFEKPSNVVRNTVQAGLDVLSKLVGLQAEVFDVDDIVSSKELLPSLLYLSEMLNYVDHRPEGFIINDEGTLIPVNGNKLLTGRKSKIPSLKK